MSCKILLILSVVVFLTSCNSIYDTYRSIQYNDMRIVAQNILDNPNMLDSILWNSSYVDMSVICSDYPNVFGNVLEPINNKGYKYKYYDSDTYILISHFNRFYENTSKIIYRIIFKEVTYNKIYCTVLFQYDENNGWKLVGIVNRDSRIKPHL